MGFPSNAQYLWMDSLNDKIFPERLGGGDSENSFGIPELN
jgi:hypothetical protein